MDAKLRELHDRALVIGGRADHFAEILLADQFPGRRPQSVPYEINMAARGQGLIMALLEHEENQIRRTMDGAE